MFFQGENARLEFIQIGKGFRDVTVHQTGSKTRDLGICFIGLVKCERSDGSQQCTRRADVKKYRLPRPTRIFDRCADKLFKRIFPAILDAVESE